MENQPFFTLIAEPVLYEEHSPYKLMNKKLNDIDIDYFQGSIPLGKTVDREIEIGIKHRIVNDFVTYGNELLNSRSEEIEKEIISKVNGLVCQYKERTAALRDLDETFKYMHRFVRKQLCYIPIPMYDNAELRELYAAAKRVTLLEHVMGSNDKDVIKYYHALIEHTVWVCRMLMRRRASQFLMHMVDVLSREFDMDSKWATSYNDEPTPQQEPEIPEELLPMIEQLAENVHNKWMQTRLEQGWTYSPQRNDTEKKHPCLIPYADLPEEEKLYDRNTAIETVKFILGKGFRIE